jgi:hypothetical protein
MIACNTLAKAPEQFKQAVTDKLGAIFYAPLCSLIENAL